MKNGQQPKLATPKSNSIKPGKGKKNDPIKNAAVSE
jgi:hypothetical protein